MLADAVIARDGAMSIIHLMPDKSNFCRIQNYERPTGPKCSNDGLMINDMIHHQRQLEVRERE
jgi:hypothetical protein